MRIHAYLKLMVVFVAIAEGTSRTKTNQNFVFFQPDEMRAESLGCYGHPISKTPNFGEFTIRLTMQKDTTLRNFETASK